MMGAILIPEATPGCPFEESLNSRRVHLFRARTSVSSSTGTATSSSPEALQTCSIQDAELEKRRAKSGACTGALLGTRFGVESEACASWIAEHTTSDSPV